MIATILICDSCDDEGVPGYNRDAMQSLGWTFYGQDLCQECSSKLFSGK